MSKVTTNRITKDQILAFHSTLVMTIAGLIKERSSVNVEPLFPTTPQIIGKDETKEEKEQRHEINLNTAIDAIKAEYQRKQITVLDAKVDVLTDVLTRFEEAFRIEE